ncbi:MAG: aspartate aminotransferase family protein [PVC group bacterium]|nr:aspartate aminotransferase family protein [PVC group bacterium]
MDAQDVMDLYNNNVVGNYTKVNLVISRARGSWVWDTQKRLYLDFFPGWAVSGIGHCHKRVVKAISNQAKQLLHVSNNYYNELQGKLAQRISLNSFGGKVFFCNSGAEANEAAFKLARAFGHPNRHEIITMEKSFHGRTLACTAATGQEVCQKGMGPMPDGFKSVPFNDKQALINAVSDKTAAIMIELIQGEGGVRVAGKEYVRFVRDFCFQKNILLIIDEVQTGMGRTGELFAYQHYGIEPDMMTLAKSLGGGMPIGAMVVQKKIAGMLKPGMHASTFGGSPIVCAAALGVFDAIEKDRLLKNTAKMGSYLRDELIRMKGRHPVIKEIRGMGLMLAVELLMNAQKAYEYCFSMGLLINCTQNNTLRIMPAMTVTKKEIDQAMEILEKAISKC